MDAATLATIVLVAGVVIGIVISLPIGVTIGVPSFLAMIVVVGDISLAAENSASRMFTGINNFTLLAIPFFVLAGVIMNKGGIAGRLVDAAKVMVGRMPAGLAQTNVAANAMFGAVSGAAVAAAAAVGQVMHPRLVKDGYKPSWAAAVNVASAPAGMLIPPSNTFIVYSLVSSTSIAALFMAGVGPGLVWTLAVALVVLFTYKRNRVADAAADVHPTFKQAVLVIWRAIPSLLMIFIVVGGILFGWFTATESSAIAVAYCLVLSFVYGTVKVREIPGILIDAGRTTAIVMLLVGVSSILSFVMSFAQIPQMISEALLGLTDSQTVILIIMMVILLFVGTFMDPTPAILIFVPMFIGIIDQFGIDRVHFGTMIVYNLCVGVITPPVGNVLFVGTRVAGIRLEPVIGKLLWFLISIIIGLFIVVFVPEISMWLPTVLGLV
ncbi:TRAP transporter large permease [Tessaracoccus oleiagri]|uniref:TRAP transporter, DctM subunit n=1 Tax=Tessaracoccus oleiagri TaxID=686624 RepID=A0A1G9MJQ4_9ACTN|nr:TRAP transporter large permease [Tessaracoccus oleiagri]SDL74313.1 TRAP transporter, DctM subunit [Tessaracoccus oleiagri]